MTSVYGEEQPVPVHQAIDALYESLLTEAMRKEPKINIGSGEDAVEVLPVSA